MPVALVNASNCTSVPAVIAIVQPVDGVHRDYLDLRLMTGAGESEAQTAELSRKVYRNSLIAYVAFSAQPKVCFLRAKPLI